MKKIVSRKPVSLTKKRGPKIIEWNGIKMCSNHSIKILVRRLAKRADKTKFVQVNVIGAWGYGLSEMCNTLAHMMHQALNKDYGHRYSVKYVDKQHLPNIHEVVAEAGTPTIVVMDSISYFRAEVSARKVKDAFTKLRNGTQRVVLITNYHYGTAIPPMLRNASVMQIYLSLSFEERQLLPKIVRTRYTRTLERFSRMSITARDEKKWIMKCGKHRVEYEWRKPFVLAMAVEDSRIRLIVFPLRSWIDPRCGICDPEQKATK